MDLIARLWVGHPFHIALVSIAFFALYAWLDRRPRGLLVAAVGWALAALWEGIVLATSPGANIRVDLLVLWPALAIPTALALVTLVRSIATYGQKPS